jgi:hypothetical protein
MFRNSNRSLIVALAIIGSLAFACIQTASAATSSAAVTWTRATAYTDGTSLPASAISGHKIVCTFTPASGTAAPCTLSASSAAGSAQTLTTTLTYPAVGGQACFQLVTTANGVDSVPSAVTAAACKAFDPLTPNPPGNVSVTITLALTLTSDSPITVAMAAPVVTKKP